ncbi:MAG: PIG-L family deacetylase [Pyrinomonadaceae bacterium]|nr:PIG-L family deacetylase [Pyrinomonadaceae bacterium]
MFNWLKKLNPYRHRAFVRELLALRAQRGPYRFAVREWRGISDMELARRVLEVESFRSEVQPLPLPVEKLKSILVLAPHQDDESIGPGGSLLLASKAGVKIHVLYITDGAQTKTDQPANVRFVRAQEAERACAQLGAQVHNLGISNLAPKPSLDDVDRLSNIILETKPDIVMAPWLLDWPSKHRLVNHLLWLAHKRSGIGDFEVWGYQVHNTPFVNGYVDITTVAEEKRRLLECYQSQNRFCRYDHIAMGLAAWNAHLFESTPDPRYFEVFCALPGAEFFQLVADCYFDDLSKTYRGDLSVIGGLEAAHQAVMRESSRGKNRHKVRQSEEHSTVRHYLWRRPERITYDPSDIKG